MKKVVSIMMVILMVAMMTACHNPQPVDPIVTNSAVEAEYNAATYVLDSWREDGEDGERTYYTTLLMYSEDYYSAPTVDDVKYKTDDGYKPLMEAIEGSSVTVYNVNTEFQSGICAYAKIKTNALIDAKKIYVLLAGPSEYDETTLTKEDYVAKHGYADGWRALLTSISSKSAPVDKAAAMQTSLYSRVIRFADNEHTQYYYMSDVPQAVVENNSIMTKFFVDPMKNCDLETFVSNVMSSGVAAKIVDGVAEEIELDERLQVAGKVVDGEVWLGFETVDGSDFSKYDGEVPDAIVCPYGNACCFVIQSRLE